jgi:hypothetical protein
MLLGRLFGTEYVNKFSSESKPGSQAHSLVVTLLAELSAANEQACDDSVQRYKSLLYLGL